MLEKQEITVRVRKEGQDDNYRGARSGATAP